MKISVNNKELFSLSDIQKRVICNDIHSDILDADLERRLQWVITHKYEQCMKRLRDEWMLKLKDRVESVPTSDDAFASLVFSQPDYKDKKCREAQIL